MSFDNSAVARVDSYPASDYPENWSPSLQLHHATSLVNTNEAIDRVNDLTMRVSELEERNRRLAQQIASLAAPDMMMNGGNG